MAGFVSLPPKVSSLTFFGSAPRSCMKLNFEWYPLWLYQNRGVWVASFTRILECYIRISFSTEAHWLTLHSVVMTNFYKVGVGISKSSERKPDFLGEIILIFLSWHIPCEFNSSIYLSTALYLPLSHMGSLSN